MNPKVIQYIHQEYLGLLRSLVLRNSGTPDDARDLMMDTLIILFEQCKKPEFQLTCKFKTYLYAIAKRLWLQRLERVRQYLYYAASEVREPQPQYHLPDDEGEEYRAARWRIFYRHFSTLPMECRMLLELFSQKRKMNDIAASLGYSSVASAKSRKYACKSMLIRRLKNDPMYKQFLKYE